MLTMTKCRALPIVVIWIGGVAGSIEAGSMITADPPTEQVEGAGSNGLSPQSVGQSADIGLGCGRAERRERYFSEAKIAPERDDDVPEWVKDSIWYYIDVPAFRNGETANDAPGTPPWGAAICARR